MDQDQWNGVDSYFVEMLVGSDSQLDGAVSAAAAAGLPSIHVSPPQGKLLHLLALFTNARNILEIGTLGGYSTIWLARALPAGGKLVSLELSDLHARTARDTVAKAGLADKVEINTGRAVDSIARLAGPFDMIFVDADKPSNPDYFNAAMKLARPGGMLVIDNVVYGGNIADPASTNAGVQATRRMLRMIRDNPRITATAIQTVGSKGYDGMLIARIG